MKKLMPKPKGFTIIEVIIVLVVGAVIMIAVFLVIPQLQQSARNNQRTRDAQRVLTAVRQYYSQNPFPTFTEANPSFDITSIVQGIVGTPFNDPNLKEKPGDQLPKAYTIKVRLQNRVGIPTWIDVILNQKCKTNQSSVQNDSNLEPANGSIAVSINLEPLKTELFQEYYGSRSWYCIND